jgi:hypothetical protein
MLRALPLPDHGNMKFPDWVKRGEKFKAYGYIWEVL